MSRFHGREQLTAILEEAGFSEVRVHPLLLGAVAIHEAIR